MNYKNQKFFIEPNLLVGLNGVQCYLIKIDDEQKTPFAMIPLGSGIPFETALDQAKEKAEYIVECLNQNAKI